MNTKAIRDYTGFEERLHSYSHGIAALVAIVGFILLLNKVGLGAGVQTQIAVWVYGLTMIATFLTSALYHQALNSPKRDLLKLIDHIAIYFKISGGFTLYALVLLPSTTALGLMIWTWGATALGVGLKTRAYLKGTAKKFNPMSLLFYLGMGWAGIAIIDQLYNLMPPAGFWWLVAGGSFYTFGTIFYALKSIPYTHFIWHLFVVAGSFCIFINIYGYIF